MDRMKINNYLRIISKKVLIKRLIKDKKINLVRYKERTLIMIKN